MQITISVIGAEERRIIEAALVELDNLRAKQEQEFNKAFMPAQTTSIVNNPAATSQFKFMTPEMAAKVLYTAPPPVADTPPTDSAKVTTQSVTDALRGHISKHGIASATKLLNEKFDAKRISDVPEDRYPELFQLLAA